MGAIDEVKSETRQRMDKTIESLRKDLSHIRAGRATPNLFDNVRVDYYGSPMPINQVANISIPEARLVLIQPWEKTMLSAIEKAIQTSDLGLNPQNDGNLIRVPIPALSEERRKDLVKNSKKIAEESKVAVRNIRRDSNEKLKKSEKDKEISEDDSKKAQADIQKLTDDKIVEIDKLIVSKEKEIFEI